MKFSLLIARFPYGGTESAHTTDWLVKTVLAAKADARIGSVEHMSVNDTPITMTRNRVLKAALDRKIDLVLMVDSDMKPDLYLGQPGTKPFFKSSLDFMALHSGPSVVAAPYCGPPPHENIYVFRWANRESDQPNADMRLEQYTREEAAQRVGMEEVAALPTGVFMIDMRAVERLAPPWFEYEYADAPLNTQKATTEDVFFTRNLSLAGVPQYVNWDAWAGHMKTKCVGKPALLTVDSVRKEFREALQRGNHSLERLVDVRREGI